MEGLEARQGGFGSADNDPATTTAVGQAWWVTPRVAIPGSVLLVVVLIVFLGPVIWRQPVYGQQLDVALQPPVFFGGTWSHPLGTDNFGRDVLARLLAGGQVSLLLSFMAIVGAMIIGVGAGVVAGYVGGFSETILMRLVDVQLAFPPFLLALSVLAGLPPGLGPLLMVLVLSGWVAYARLVRSEVLVLRRLQYVDAAIGLGASGWQLMIRHLLPNVASTVLVVSTLLLSQMIILQAGLSFLGLGVQPPAPSWGGALSDGLSYLTQAWWLATMPGLALMIVILLVNLLGDALRDALDPRLRV